MDYHEMLTVFYRTLVLYVGVLIVIRIMGKREVGQLSPFDLVVAIMIAESAAISMENLDQPLFLGFIPVLTLMTAEVLFSYISLKNKWLRHLITGTPSVIIERGVIMEKEMRKIRYNINDLLSQLREKNAHNINDVEYAILETSGELSVIMKSDKRAATPADLNVAPPYEGLPLPLIYDTEINEDNLRKAGKDHNWLYKKLKENNVKGPEEVLLASLDVEGNLFISCKQNIKTN